MFIQLLTCAPNVSSPFAETFTFGEEEKNALFEQYKSATLFPSSSKS